MMCLRYSTKDMGRWVAHQGHNGAQLSKVAHSEKHENSMAGKKYRNLPGAQPDDAGYC